MANIDDELMKAAEEDAREVAFIQNYLPQELKDKFTEDDIYYFIDVILEYFSNAKPDAEGYIDVDLDQVTDFVLKQAKKDKMGDFSKDDIFFVVQAELDYNEQLEE